MGGSRSGGRRRARSIHMGPKRSVGWYGDGFCSADTRGANITVGE